MNITRITPYYIYIYIYRERERERERESSLDPSLPTSS
jgi:hypothetical protein